MVNAIRVDAQGGTTDVGDWLKGVLILRFVSLNINPYAPIDSSDVVLPPAPETHPWRRYFARRIDYLIWSLSVGFLLGMTGRMPENQSQPFDLLFDIFLVLTWIPAEAAFLTLAGGTPGKLLFGIEVRSSTGERLGLVSAFRRSLWVAMVGVGFGIPVLTLIGSWRGWQNLSDAGSTMWDEPEGHVVTHRGFQWWHLGATLFVLLLIAVLLYLNGMLLMPFLERLRPSGAGSSGEG